MGETDRNDGLHYCDALRLRRALLGDGLYYTKENRDCMYLYGKEALKRQIYVKPTDGYSEKVCPVCKRPVSREDRYCSNCGSRIKPQPENKNRVPVEEAYGICETVDSFGGNEELALATVDAGSLTQARQLAAKYLPYDAVRTVRHNGDFEPFCPTCHSKRLTGGKYCPDCGQRISFAGLD